MRVVSSIVSALMTWLFVHMVVVLNTTPQKMINDKELEALCFGVLLSGIVGVVAWGFTFFAVKDWLKGTGGYGSQGAWHRWNNQQKV
jgi:hypothetical protein